MNIACLSGKGGAGKTFVAVNLAYAAGGATYIDCDVEEPNGRLFFKPCDISTEKVTTLLPVFDQEKCICCKKCVSFCKFNALMCVKDKPTVFPEVCHGCGGCMLVCENGAVSEKEVPVGVTETGTSGNVRVVTGILNPGEASGVPVIRAALKAADAFTVTDCPPGSACSVMECVEKADHCIIVAEPTAFGFHNFKMVHELTALLGKKCSVVINKQETPYAPLEEYCEKHGLAVLARIPYDRDIAAKSAKGHIISSTDDSMRAMFEDILKKAGGAAL